MMPKIESSGQTRLFEWAAVAAIVLTIVIVTSIRQPRVTYQNGEGWDGVDYTAMARCFAAGKVPAAGAPYINRIAAPFLAALIDRKDVLDGFLILNIAAGAVTAFLFVIWLRLHLQDWRIRVLMVTLYCLAFSGSLRYSFYYPANTDPLTHLAIIVGVLLLHYVESKPAALAAGVMTGFAILAAPVREMTMVFPAGLIFRQSLIGFDPKSITIFRLNRRPSLWLLLPIAAGILGLIAVRLWVIRIPNWYYGRGLLLTMILSKSLVSYLHSWFIAYGPIIALLIWKGRECYAYLWQRQSLLAAFAGICALAWFGGDDTERYHAWAFPIIYMLIGRVIEGHRTVLRVPAVIAVLAVGQVIAERVLFILPDFPLPAMRTWVVLTIWGNRFNLTYLSSMHATPGISFLGFLEYLIVVTALVLWLRYIEATRPTPGRAGAQA